MGQLSDRFVGIFTVIIIIFSVFAISFFTVLTNESFLAKNSFNESIHTEVMNNIFYGAETTSLTLSEAEHIRDVRNVISAVLITLMIALPLAVLLLLWSGKWFLLKVSGIVSLLIILLTILLPFGRLFDLMHKIFFTTGSWIFPPYYLLIKTYPEEFFRNFFTRSLIISLFFGILLYVLSFIEKLKYFKKRI